MCATKLGYRLGCRRRTRVRSGPSSHRAPAAARPKARRARAGQPDQGSTAWQRPYPPAAQPSAQPDVALSATSASTVRRRRRDAMSQAETGGDERYIVVSTDGHVGPSVKEQLRPYCEAEAPRRVRPVRGGDGRRPDSSPGGRPRRRTAATRAGRWRQAPAPICATTRPKEFGKVAGFRNADQLDRSVPPAELRGEPRARAAGQRGRVADMDRSGVAALRHLPRRPERPVDPVLDDGADLVGPLALQRSRTGRRAHLQPVAGRLRRRGARAPHRHRPHPDLRSRGVRP